MAGGPNVTLDATGDEVTARLNEAEFTEANCEAVARRLFQLVDEARPATLLMDLGDVQSLDSRELGKLVALHKKVAASGGKLILVNASVDVYEAFESTMLTKLLEVRPAP